MLIQIDKPLRDLMVTQSNDAYMCHLALGFQSSVKINILARLYE